MALEIIKTVTETFAKPKKAAKEFDKHKTWYNEAMPVALSAKHPELGRARVVGSPRDTAAEYAGAMDWAQRSPFGKNTDSALAAIYQLLNHGLTKNALDNIVQDWAAIKTGKGKKLSESEILDLAAKYASENDYGEAPTDILPPEEDTPMTQLYANGGAVINQSIPPRPMSPRPMPQGMPPRPMPPQGMPQGIPQGMPQAMPQGMPPRPMPPQGMPQAMPQGMPQAMPQGMPQAMPQAQMPQGGIPGITPAMLNQNPAQGGMQAKNYTNPFGLRAFERPDPATGEMGYGGEMLPKSDGWLGHIPGQGPLEGQIITEMSADDEQGSYPMVVPTLDGNERDMISRGQISDLMRQKALEWRSLMHSRGESPFYNAADEGNR
jgi:hypothetical protein